MRGLTQLLPVAFDGLQNGTPVYIVATDEVDGVESAPSAEITITPQPIASLVESIAALNDTGVTWCTDLSLVNQACPQASLPNQDGEVGRDAEAGNGQLLKTGIGQGGFDFTKLDDKGAALPNDASSWTCVKDNVTGLVWEVKLAQPGLRDVDNVYTWYQPNELLNGGDQGQPDGGSCTGSACDTYAYINALNATGLCGFNDWRLPTRRELASVIDYGLHIPAFDETVFPVLPSSNFNFFWSSTVSSATAEVGFGAWVAYIATGELTVNSKTIYNFADPAIWLGSIMAVRSDAAP